MSVPGDLSLLPSESGAFIYFFLISVINPFTTATTEAGQNRSECFLQKFQVLRFYFSRSPHSLCLLRRLKTTSVLGITLPRVPLALSSQNSHWRKLEAQSGTTRHVALVLFRLAFCFFFSAFAFMPFLFFRTRVFQIVPLGL